MAAEIASDGVPEAPRSSLPATRHPELPQSFLEQSFLGLHLAQVHPSGIWDTAGNHELCLG